MAQAPGILFSFAHPDDESFLVAGTGCAYGARGVRLALFTATRGGAGKVGDPPVCAREEITGVRARELSAATAILGIDDVTLLDYPDGALGDVPADDIRRHLVRLIRRHRPAVVVTFDPNGANGHRDHVAISRFTSDAIAAASDPRWYEDEGAPHEVRRLVWTPPAPWWSDRDQTLGVDFRIDVHAYWERKAAALRAHWTQHQSINRIFFANEHAAEISAQPRSVQPTGDLATRSGAEISAQPRSVQPTGDLATQRVADILSVEAFRQAWGPRLPERPTADLLVGL